ncbi:MAG: universal stress protein [Verrucomicrobiota bacterium]|jgi:nucleotide-binding universal stress UspA family protein|nr:universal stress protein [Verrucomicrobiota bacterium]
MKATAESIQVVLDYMEEKLAPPVRLNRILVPIDYSGNSEKAVRYACRFAEVFDATISVIHVVSYKPPLIAGGLVPVGTVSYRKEWKETLTRWGKQIIPEEYHGDFLIREGNVCREICDTAEQVESDLVVISTHGETGLQHALLGSTAERVVQRASCPVLVVRD